ncbi:uncharacterized protein V6R79_017404 [Siganus canaliculatus]
MAARPRRERYILTVGNIRLLGDYDVALPWPGPRLVVTNLRNRPLLATTVNSLRECLLSLHHNLVTGSRDFPLIPFEGYFLFWQKVRPFGCLKLETMENHTPSDLVMEPPGLVVPTTDPRSAGPTLLLPVHPERTEPVALLDHRNCVRSVVVDGRTLTRVISPVYRSDHSELANRWRVSDYTVEGRLVMSVLCQFTKRAEEPERRRRKSRPEQSRPDQQKRANVTTVNPLIFKVRGWHSVQHCEPSPFNRKTPAASRPFAPQEESHFWNKEEPLTSSIVKIFVSLFTSFHSHHSIMSLLTHVLACLFGMGSWVAINGMWVELPLIVPGIPEGWYLPSYLTVLIQMANIGPLFITLMHRFRPGVLDERPVIYCIVGLGIIATFLQAFLWKYTVTIGDSLHSVPLLVLSFLLSVVDCTSSVTFLPFMMRLRPQYLTTYFAGEGLSGLVPALVALIQGVGVVHCQNATLAGAANQTTDDGTMVAELQAVYQPAKFSAEVFFMFLSAMMVVCLIAFILLNHHPSVARERKNDLYYSSELASGNRDQALSLHAQTPEQKPMISPLEAGKREPRSSFGRGTYSNVEVVFIFVVLAWVNALTNAVLPSVQSYSCLPYGNKAYHLAATMAAVANPVACFIAMFMPVRSLVFMGFLTMIGTGFGAYIMAMAALSPCPLLVHSDSGTAVIVLTWILFVLSLSYVKVIIGVILRDEGHSALVWCGAVVQLGSMLGAISMFPLVSVYELFRSGDPCNTKCPM